MSNWTDTISAGRSARRSTSFSGGPLRRLLHIVIAGVDLVLMWQARAQQRHQLASLNDRVLKDIGISRVDAHREADKPFWRP